MTSIINNSYRETNYLNKIEFESNNFKPNKDNKSVEKNRNINNPEDSSKSYLNSKKRAVNFGFSQLYVNPNKNMINNTTDYGLFVQTFDSHTNSKLNSSSKKKVTGNNTMRGSGGLCPSKNSSVQSFDVKSKKESIGDEEYKKSELSPKLK